jgi:hypothetical protein
MARDAGQPVGTSRPDDLGCEPAKRRALAGGGVESALHLQNRRARQAGLAVAWIALEQHRQVSQRGVEIVRALAQRCPHQQDVGRWFGLLPPASQGSLGVAGKTRIALDPPDFGVATGELNGEIEPSGLLCASSWRSARNSRAVGSVAERQTLQDLVVGPCGT